MEHFFSRVQVNIQNQNKKRSSPEMEHFFLSTDLHLDAHQSQIDGGDADEDHTQIVGEYTVKWLVVIYPPIPPPPPLVSAPLL